MPYTNTHHPSNTRTTVTIVLSIIFGVSIIPTTALGTGTTKKTLIYTLENADFPTLYQEVKVKIQRSAATTTGDANGFPDTDTFQNTDEVYFIRTTTTTAKCGTPPTGVTPRKVTVISGSDFAIATIIIKSPEFTVNMKYQLCYRKAAVTPAVTSGSTTVPPKVYDVLYRLPGGSSPTKEEVSFFVSPSMFTAHATEPATVPAGHQGPVKLSITVAEEVIRNPVKGSVLGKGATEPHPYLIPCPTASCSKDDISALCSKQYTDSALKTGDVAGFSTGKLTTTFNAPANPTSPYMICIPYCSKAACVGDTVSWALVNSNPITFTSPNTDGRTDGSPDKSPPQKENGSKEKKDDTTGKKTPTDKLPEVSVTVPPKPDVNKSTTLSATAISSTIPAVLITSVVFLYLYNW